ncbi:MAG: hypothetical protein KC656_30520 [Myxococcales bacterium]|nr:hypothetical protein [Myxococcales bacterium]
MRTPSLLLSCLVACGSPSADGEPTPPEPCNGRSDLCDRRLDQVVLPATHNSMSSAEDGFLAPNQQFALAQQLDDGIRGFLLDTYLWEGEAWACHSNCAWGARRLDALFADVVDFLDEHPREVLVFVLQDSLSQEDTEDVLREVGLLERIHAVADPEAPWPTLEALIDAGTPVVMTRESGGAGPDWYRPFYDLGFDTPYSFREPEDFTCDVLRGAAEHALFLVNHWVSRPLPVREGGADVVNQADVLGPRVEDCTAAYGRPPNLVAVDHYDVGDLFEVVDAANDREAEALGDVPTGSLQRRRGR